MDSTEKKETLILFAKDFFGDSIDATLSFEQDGRVIHTDTFSEGFIHVTLPDQVEPGVYDLVARRDGVEYRVNSFMVPLATHYFRHAQRHGDIKLKGGNFYTEDGDPAGPPIERRKFNPLLYHYINSAPPDLLQSMDEIALYNANPNSLRWGGMLRVEGDYLVVDRGEVFYKGRLYDFPETRMVLPTNLGIYRVGIVAGNPMILSTGVPDVPLGTLRIESPDFLRIDVSLPYHTLYRGGYSFFFTHYDKTTKDATWLEKDGHSVTGLNYKGKIHGKGWSTLPVNRVKLNFNGTGPVVRTDRLYIYATADFFLLWEGDTLLTSLPRWTGSGMILEWGEDHGLSFDSYGSNGHSRFSVARPYRASHVQFKSGPTPVLAEESIGKKVTGFNRLGWDDLMSWTVKFRTSNAQLLWNGDDITSSSLPLDTLLPHTTLFPD